MDHLQPRLRLVRMLISDVGEAFTDSLAMITHWSADQPITLMSVSPPSEREQDVLDTAARQPFDFAVLFLHNIIYNSGDRSRLEEDSAALVREMIELFHKPIIAVWTYPDSPDYAARILDAGATGALHAPYDYEPMRDALRKCLGL